MGARPDPEQWLAAADAAELIGVTRQGINKLIKDGRLPAKLVKFGGATFYQIKRGDLDRYVATRRHSRHMLLPAHYVSSIEEGPALRLVPTGS